VRWRANAANPGRKPSWLDPPLSPDALAPAEAASLPGWLEEMLAAEKRETSVRAVSAVPASQPDDLSTTLDVELLADAPGTAAPGPPVPEVGPAPQMTPPPATEAMGFDPETGRVVDAQKMQQWQQLQSQKETIVQFPVQSPYEVYRRARKELEEWIDQDARRDLIMADDERADL